MSSTACHHEVVKTSSGERQEDAAITTLEDLEPAIELFHALIGLGRFDDTYHLFRNRLDDALYYWLGAGRLRHELLANLLPQRPGDATRVRRGRELRRLGSSSHWL